MKVFASFYLENSDENLNTAMQGKKISKKTGYLKRLQRGRNHLKLFSYFSDARFLMTFKQLDNKGKVLWVCHCICSCFHKIHKNVKIWTCYGIIRNILLKHAGKMRDGTVSLLFPYLLS